MRFGNVVFITITRLIYYNVTVNKVALGRLVEGRKLADF